MPRGALDFKTFEVKEGLEGVIEDINAAAKRYQGKPADYSYPRSARGAKAQGCYLRVYGEERVVFGFDRERLSLGEFMLGGLRALSGEATKACYSNDESYLGSQRSEAPRKRLRDS
jgi:hypothetical protein